MKTGFLDEDNELRIYQVKLSFFDSHKGGPCLTKIVIMACRAGDRKISCMRELEVITLTTNDTRDKEMDVSTKDRVCFCPMKDPKRIGEFVHLAKNQNATAVLVPGFPRVHLETSVIEIDMNLAAMIENSKRVTVIFKLLKHLKMKQDCGEGSGKPGTRSDNNDPPIPDIQADTPAGNDTFTLFNMSAEDKSRGASNTKSSDGPETPKLNLIIAGGKLISAVKGFFSWPHGKTSETANSVGGKDDAMKQEVATMLSPENDGWTVEGEFKNYEASYKLLQHALTEKNDTIEVICTHVVYHLVCQQVNLIYLAFALRLYERVGMMRGHKAPNAVVDAVIVFLAKKTLTREMVMQPKNEQKYFQKKAAHSILFLFVMRISFEEYAARHGDMFLVNSFAIYYHTRENPSITTMAYMARQLLNPQACLVHFSVLSDLVGRMPALTATCCVQSSIPGIAEVMLSNEVVGEEMEIAAFGTLVAHLIKELLSKISHQTDEAEVVTNLQSCFAVIDHEVFLKDTALRGEVMRSICERASYAVHHRFDQYESYRNFLPIEHKDHKIFQDTLRKQMMQDIEEMTSLETAIHPLINLLACRAFVLLQSVQGLRAVLKPWKKLVITRVGTRSKLRFIKCVIERFVTGHILGAEQAGKHALRMILDLVAFSPDLLEALLVFTKDYPAFLSSTCALSERQLESIADAVVTSDSVMKLLQNPTDTATLFKGHDQAESEKLFPTFLTSLCGKVRGGKDMVAFVLKAFKGLKDSEDDFVKGIFLRLLDSSIDSWQPQTVYEIVSLPQHELDIVLTCLESVTSLASSCERFKAIVTGVVDSIEQDNLTFSLCQKLSEISLTSSWQRLGQFASETLHRTLPDSAEIDAKTAEHKSLSQTLVTLGAINNMTLTELFSRYGCVPEGELQEFLNTNPAGDLALSKLREIVNFATEFHSSQYHWLALLSYFHTTVSVIFNDFLRQETDGQQVMSYEKLVESVGAAESNVEAMFNERANLGNVGQAVKIVHNSKSTIHREIAVLTNCHELKLQSDKNFLLLVAICRLGSPLRDALNFCTKCGFTCSNDIRMRSLQQATEQFYGTSPFENGVSECFHFGSECFRHFTGDDAATCSIGLITLQLESILPHLTLLGLIAENIDVWIFVKDMKWFGKEGLRQFYEEYNNVTNIIIGISKGSFEMSLLDRVMPTVRVLSAVGSLLCEETVSKFVAELTNHSDLKLLSLRTFEESVEAVRQNVSQIREWFTGGADELQRTIAALDAANATGEYDFDATGSLRLMMKISSAEADTNKKVLSGSALEELVTQLELVERDSDKADDIEGFLDQFYMMKSCAVLARDLHQVGFATWQHVGCSCRVGKEFLRETNDLLSRLKQERKRCTEWLAQIRNTYPSMLLFWTEELQEIHEHLVSLQGTPSDDRLQALGHQLRAITDAEGVKVPLSTITTTAEELHSSEWDLIADEELSWLEGTSKFIHRFKMSVIDKGSPISRKDGKGAQKGNVVLHRLEGTNRSQACVILEVLQDVYKERLPFAFEILDGRFDASIERVEAFLRRALHYTSCTFTVLHVDAMDRECLELIARFFSSRSTSDSSVRFHCLQREGSVLHPAPWVQLRLWDSERTRPTEARESRWRQLILASGAVKEVSIIESAICGAGKSHFIRNLAEKMESGDSLTKITIHERSSITSLIQTFRTVTKAVHISFGCLPKLGSSAVWNDWLSTVEYLFFSILILRRCSDWTTRVSQDLRGRQLSIFVELPSEGDIDPTLWSKEAIPSLHLCATMLSPDTIPFHFDDHSYRVCLYLRAYRDKTINRKFTPRGEKGLMFVIDVSGSMEANLGDGRSALQVAVDNALLIFDKHVSVNDSFGVLLFDHSVHHVIRTHRIENERARRKLRGNLDGLRGSAYWGGTNMYGALLAALRDWHSSDTGQESWLVCLTDGASADSEEIFRQPWMDTSESINLIVVGVNLATQLERRLRLLCRKYKDDSDHTKTGFFVRSEANARSLTDAFGVVSSSLPVSETFAFDGHLTAQDCKDLVQMYLPHFVSPQDRRACSFWLKFLYRRVRFFDKNHEFNFNESQEFLGETLMSIMLKEVEQLLAENHSCEWLEENYSQLIYDFSNSEQPKFRFICTSPTALPPDMRNLLENLNLPGFRIPDQSELEHQHTLERYLSQAMNLKIYEGADGVQRLVAFDQNQFVLTLDFTMKLLRLHERVVCGTPCIIEGETGVSKTALTRMYAILRNQAIQEQVKAVVEHDIAEMRSLLDSTGLSVCNQESLCGLNEEQTVRCIMWIEQRSAERPDVFQAIPEKLRDPSSPKEIYELIEWFSGGHLEPFFHTVNVDNSLTETDMMNAFEEPRRVARRVASSNVLVVVFLDEINTSSALGLLKEIVTDRTIGGEVLEENIVLVAACNPARQVSTRVGKTARQIDRAEDWISGHYQVQALPPSLQKLKWSFGALSSAKEKEFIQRRIEMMISSRGFTTMDVVFMTELVAEAQKQLRTIAETHLEKQGVSSFSESENDRKQRAASVVSLRDIQRALSMFEFLLDNSDFLPEGIRTRESMKLALAVTHLLRLDSTGRQEFCKSMKALQTETSNTLPIEQVLDLSIEKVLQETQLPKGVAATRGLKENVFMTLLCVVSRTPVIIIGPPGCSKTLSVNIIADNTNGNDSPNKFYQELPRLSLFHYQCSKETTSKEIAAVFRKATQRQEKLDAKEHRCFVFMDEAGLPEEEKESLKVLHYLLEGHMSTKPDVGFVAITNHVLDAAKSNRCVALLREDPDSEEMQQIAHGVLFHSKLSGEASVDEVVIDGHQIPRDAFSDALHKSYHELQTTDSEFANFFGLRDFIYMLKAIKERGREEAMKLHLASEAFHESVFRNFNGNGHASLARTLAVFIRNLPGRQALPTTKQTMSVLQDALSRSFSNTDMSTKPRFKLVVDQTNDDSIARLIHSSGLVDSFRRSLFKLSHLPEDFDREKMRLITGVKLAAQQGKVAFLSQTNAVNESFYDLFNHHFRSIMRDGEPLLYANIAAGGVSRRSLVSTEFECIIHIRASELDAMPAPFLNRFEKYSLGLEDVLEWELNQLKRSPLLFDLARTKVHRIVSEIGADGLLGYDNHMIDSIILSMLSLDSAREAVASGQIPSSFTELIHGFMKNNFAWDGKLSDVSDVVRMAQESFNSTNAEVLREIMNGGVELAVLERSLESTLCDDFQKTTLSSVCGILVQMVIVGFMCRKVIQVAKPEALYANRNGLPQELLKAYFEQEHFCFRALVSQLQSDARRLKNLRRVVVHTRTSSFLHTIPSKQNSALNEHDKQILEEILPDVDNSVIVHLASLRSESEMRALLEEWWNNTKQSVFVLVVDMSQSASIEIVNYVRMFVDDLTEATSGLDGKVLTIVLHYLPGLLRSGYPVAFLGGWDHCFLDNIRASPESRQVGSMIKGACLHEASDSSLLEHMGPSLSNYLAGVLDKMMPQLGLSIHFYPSQCGHDLTSRSILAQEILNRNLGEESTGEILCSKFARVWLEKGLLKTAKRTYASIIQKTTQLPLSSSIQGVLIETFTNFVIMTMTEINQWLNADLLRETMSDEVDELFGKVLKVLPDIPFEELRLYQPKLDRLRSLPFDGKMCPPARFPFFSLISNFLEKLVDSAESAVALVSDELESQESFEVAVQNHALALLYPNSTGELESKAEVFEQQEHQLVAMVLDFVQKSEGSELSRLYFWQLMEWKFRSSLNEFPAEFIKERIRGLFGQSNVSLLSLHIAVSLEKLELVRTIATSIYVQCRTSITEDLNDLDVNTKNRGLTVFSAFLESLLVQGTEDVDTLETWCKACYNFFNHATYLLGNVSLDEIESDNANLASRFRFLGFVFNVAKSVPISIAETRVALLEQLQSVGSLTSMKDYSSFRFQSSDEDWSPPCHDMLEFFFAKSFWGVSSGWVIEDFGFLLDYIAEGGFGESRGDYACAMLENACSALQTMHGWETRTFGVSIDSLLLLTQKLDCDRSSEFADDGNRRKMPHFIPSWLSGQSPSSSSGKSLFFVEYTQSFSGELSDTVFRMILKQVVNEVNQLSSEEVFLHFLAHYDEETQLSLTDHERLSRLRVIESSAHAVSLLGTSGAAMLLDALLICLISSLARELATDDQAAVLLGPYRQHFVTMLNEAMQVKSLDLQAFFFCQVARFHSESQAYALLSRQRFQDDFPWCHRWLSAVPDSIDDATQALKEARENLDDAEREEKRKSSEWRLCPNCGKPFIVAERNCGNFTCGKTAGSVGHGCGEPFHIDSCGTYQVDEGFLSSLRKAVDDADKVFRRKNNDSSLWKRARSMKLPTLWSPPHFQGGDQPRLLPSLCLPGIYMRNRMNSDGFLSLLDSWRQFHDQLKHLPDLIELYVWIHIAFRHILTREKAYAMKLDDILTQDTLGRRYNQIRVSDKLQLWQRIKDGWRQVINDLDGALMWNCSEIRIPFASLEEANLIAFISEGDSPEDGNDFLFLLISHLIDRYNAFARNLSQYFTQPVEESEEIYPQFITNGCGGIAVLGTAINLDLDVVTFLSCWDSNEGEFDIPKIEETLARVVNSHTLSFICSPLAHLREKFRFRDVSVVSSEMSASGVAVLRARNGLYFAQSQDHRLFESIEEQATTLMNSSNRDFDLWNTFSNLFHTLEYHELRSVLEGLQNLLHHSLGQGSNHHKSAGEMMSTLGVETMTEIGFPEFNRDQRDLFWSLQPVQLGEFVQFLGFQLASESYNYASLELCMTDHISNSDAKALQEAVLAFMDIEGFDFARRCLDDFVEGVLDLYKLPIRDAALEGNGSLYSFLHSFNFCDSETFPLFASLPESVSLRQFISLRQHMHQLRAAVIYDQQHSAIEEQENPARRLTPRKCWLWDEDDEAELTEKDLSESSDFEHLWFENTELTEIRKPDCEPVDEIAVEEITMEEAPVDEITLDEAAQLIQKFWRRQRRESGFRGFNRTLYETCDEGFMSAASEFSDEYYGMDDIWYEDEDEDENNPGKLPTLEQVKVDDRDKNGHIKHRQSTMNEEFFNAPSHDGSDNAEISSMNSSVHPKSVYSYGNEEMLFRKWIDENRMPQTLADELIEFGARDVDDVVEMQRSDMLGDLTHASRLDMIKLRKAIQKHCEASLMKLD